MKEIMNQKEIIAAIDIGTNSFHIVIAEINQDETVTIIARNREIVRLGDSGDEMKFITKEAMERGVEAMKKFAELAKIHNPKIRAIATSAVREANNGKEFIDLVRQETGIEIEIISGTEEGRLVYLGILHNIHIFDEHSLVIDIGGGSTETVIGFQGNLLFVNSEKLGAIRLTKRFFDSEINSENIKKCRQYIAGKLISVLEMISNFRIDSIVGTAGTIETIAFMAYLKKNKEISDFTFNNNGFTVSINGMLEIIAQIVDAKTPEAIIDLNGMDKKRADIILAGALIIEFILKYLKNNLGIKKILFSPYGLREGVLYDTVFQNNTSAEATKLPDLRRKTILNLAKKFNVNFAHSKQVESFSLKIFDALNKILFDFDEYERELLSYSAVLHDIGYFISHNAHHKHSLYIIENNNLPGFTNNDANLIANISRYHRKSHPNKTHEEFAVLSDKKKFTVRVLAGILRIAEGLDRRNKQFVKDIEINFDHLENILELKVIPTVANLALDIELWGANRRKLLLEMTLKINVKILTVISD